MHISSLKQMKKQTSAPSIHICLEYQFYINSLFLIGYIPTPYNNLTWQLDSSAIIFFFFLIVQEELSKSITYAYLSSPVYWSSPPLYTNVITQFHKRSF